MANCKNCGYELPAGAQFCPRCGAPVPKIDEQTHPPAAGAPSQPAVASGVVLAYWWERFLAYFIDAIIISVVATIINFVTGLALSAISGWPTWIPFLNLNGVLLFLYWMLMEGSRSQHGQSFGKMIMRIKVVKIDGAALTMGDAAIESVGKAFLLPIDLLIGWILHPRRRQRIFNYITRTVVVKVA